MSQHPETRFKCNRCSVEATVPVQNTPVHTRTAGPLDWLVLVLGTEPSTPASHLCPRCHLDFTAFMSAHAKKATGSKDGQDVFA